MYSNNRKTNSSNNFYLAWFLIQHYQHIHGVKMYKNCSNENPVSLPLSNNGVLSTDPSLLETALKEASASNRTLTSSTTFASNQLIAAANAARSAQKQQSLSTARSTTDSNSNSRGYRTAGTNSKTNASLTGLNASTTNAAYANLFQDAARVNPIFHFLQELAKQQISQTSRTDKPNTISSSQFLTPKSRDLTSSDQDSRRQKRRRPLDPEQSDDFEQKRTSSNRVSTTTTSNGPVRRLSTSSTPSISLSSSEDEPASSTQHHENKTTVFDTSIQQSISIDQPRKRHQRKPTRQKPTQISNGNSSPSLQMQTLNDTKEELGEIDDSNGIHEDNSTRTMNSLLTTGGNPASNYKWLHQAFRSLMPPQNQINDLELSRQQNSSSPQSSNQFNNGVFCSLLLIFYSIFSVND